MVTKAREGNFTKNKTQMSTQTITQSKQQF